MSNEKPIIDKELVMGKIYTRNPINKRIQTIANNFQQIAQKYKLTNKPLDVIFPPFESLKLTEIANTMVRPMLAVHTNNSPKQIDWVVDYVDSLDDVLSFCIKPNMYRNAGVSELWLIEPDEQIIVIYDFEKNHYLPKVVRTPQRLKVGIYKSLELSYSDVFRGE